MWFKREQAAQLAAGNPALVRTWLSSHVLRFFPECCAEIGPQAVQDLVDEAVARAAEEGFTEPRHVARFVDMVFEFGADFADNPRFPWARAILEDPALGTPAERSDRLHRAALDQVTRDAAAAQQRLDAAAAVKDRAEP